MFHVRSPNANPQRKLEYLKGLPQHAQRSPEWFAQRKDKLTSSDCATALGINPYQKPVDLLFKKCGAGKPFTGNNATLHGQFYEDEAIDLYCQAVGKVNHDFGLISYMDVPREDDYNVPWLAGSTDGIAEDLDNKENLIVLEVKCPYYREPKYGQCPAYYLPQVQLNMAILNIEKADFIEYKPPKFGKEFSLNIVRMQRDREWFAKNVVILETFWKEVLYWRDMGIEKHPDFRKTKKKIVFN